jgi:drug/metabolite transporter (DMT)-like permease
MGFLFHPIDRRCIVQKSAYFSIHRYSFLDYTQSMSTFEVYALAIGANLAYSSASMIFSVYAKRFSSMWINQVKVLTAFVAFLITMFFAESFISLQPVTIGYLVLSGFAGLCLGDVFLFRAFTTLGPARSLVLYSFQPLMLGLYGYFFLKQIFTVNQTLSVLCMIVCIFIFMLERNKTTGSWDVKSFIWAFLGISLDALGVMLTRSAYESAPELQTFQVNVIRCIGALIGFLMISPKSYVTMAQDFMTLRKREMSLVLGAALCGCFVSLTMYLAALKYAHVGTLTAIAITGPVWVSFLECLYHRRLPNMYLVMAFCFFLSGFYLMVIA